MREEREGGEEEDIVAIICLVHNGHLRKIQTNCFVLVFYIFPFVFISSIV